jgi:hypothetical protein
MQSRLSLRVPTVSVARLNMYSSKLTPEFLVSYLIFLIKIYNFVYK